MEIINLKIEELIPYAKNTRSHNDVQVAQIVASIKEFGFTNPILIDEDKVIIAGHGRVLAAQRLKMAELPCIMLSGLSNSQKRAYRIADNKIALNGSWEDAFLSLEISDLIGDEYNTDVMGFSDAELKKILKEDDEEEEKPEVEFTEELLESHNYVVLYFDNDIDWLQAQTLLGVKTVKALDSKEGFEKMGIGRVMKGSEAIRRLMSHEDIG